VKFVGKKIDLSQVESIFALDSSVLKNVWLEFSLETMEF